MPAIYTSTVGTSWTTIVEATTIITDFRFVQITNDSVSSVLLSNGTTVAPAATTSIYLEPSSTMTARSLGTTAILTIEDAGADATFPAEHHGIYFAYDYGTAGTGTAIQAALDAADTAGGGQVIVDGDHATTWTLTASLTIGNNTILEVAPNVTIKNSVNANNNLLKNKDQTVGNTNIYITGGTWDYDYLNQAGGTGPQLHGINLRNVTRVTLRDMKVINVSKFAIRIGDCDQVLVENITFATHSDGVHFNGPASNVTVSNIYGTTGDDMVAFVGRDYPAQADTIGDITDVTVSNIHADGSVVALKILGGTGTIVKRFYATGITGTTTQSGVRVFDDTTGSTVLSECVIENVSVIPGSGLKQIDISASGIKDLTLRNLTLDGTGVYEVWPVYIGPGDVASTIEYLKVENVVVRGNASISDGVYVTGAVTINHLDFAGFACNDGTIIFMVNVAHASSYLKEARLSGIHITGSTYARVINATGRLDYVRVSDCYKNGPGYVVQTASSTNATIIELCNGIDLAGNMVADVHGPSTVLLSNWSTAANFGVIRCLGVNATPVVIRGAGLVAPTGTQGVTRDGSQVINVQHPQIRADVAILAKANGDEAYNTNAALGTGAGRVISNGTAWKNIYSGLTEP